MRQLILFLVATEKHLPSLNYLEKKACEISSMFVTQPSIFPATINKLKPCRLKFGEPICDKTS